MILGRTLILFNISPSILCLIPQSNFLTNNSPLYQGSGDQLGFAQICAAGHRNSAKLHTKKTFIPCCKETVSLLYWKCRREGNDGIFHFHCSDLLTDVWSPSVVVLRLVKYEPGVWLYYPAKQTKVNTSNPKNTTFIPSLQISFCLFRTHNPQIVHIQSIPGKIVGWQPLTYYFLWLQLGQLDVWGVAQWPHTFH